MAERRGFILVSCWFLVWRRKEDGREGYIYGRKLQAEEGRWDTRVKISDMRRCWTEVSCEESFG